MALLTWNGLTVPTKVFITAHSLKLERYASQPEMEGTEKLTGMIVTTNTL